jgi:hypothetical protein
MRLLGRLRQGQRQPTHFSDVHPSPPQSLGVVMHARPSPARRSRASVVVSVGQLPAVGGVVVERIDLP